MPRPVALPIAALAALLSSCGHRGDPLPPWRKTPPPPQDFRLAQRGDALEVRATAPTASVDGVPYAAVVIEFLHAEGAKDLEKAGARRAVPATPGARVALALPLPAPGTLVRAAARGVAGREKGTRTLTATLVVQAPPEAPRELAAVLTGGGVSLSWRGPRPKEVAALPTAPVAAPPVKPQVPGNAPTAAPAPGAAPPAGEPRRGGFFVYRRVGEAAYANPIAANPIEARSTEDADVRAGVTVCYVVRAVASTEPLVESAPSNEACVGVRDVTAPPAPAGLAALPREGGIELLWSPSAATDLAGYRVYRTAPGGAPERLAEVPPQSSSWLDGTAARGAVYVYAVSAIDQSGNESTPSEGVEASLP